MPQPLKALFVEDLPADAELAVFELKRAGMQPVVRCVETASDMLRELEEFKPDIIVSDFSMPRFSGLDALELAQRASPTTPFIFLSGTIGEDTAIDALKRGATDYILKGNLVRLAPAVARALREAADRSGRLEAEAQLRRSEARFRLFMQHLPGIAFLKDLDGRYQFVNDAAEAAFGRSIGDIVGKADAELVPAEMAAQFRAVDLLTIERGTSMQVVDNLSGSHGTRRWLTTKFPLEHESKLLVGGVAIDVTERMLAEEALRLSERAVEASINPILITSAGGEGHPILYVNQAFERVTGYSREEAIGRDCSFLQGSDRDQPELNKIREAIREQRDGHALLRNYRKDGSLFWNDLHITPVRDPASGRVTHFVGVQQEVTETKRYQEELEHQANHDALTGLSNRNLLNDRLEQAIIQARRNGRMLTVALIDLDHFKLINDSLGHSMGDRVIKLVAERLTASVRQGDTVARLGGDEFAIVLSDQEHSEGALPVIERIAAAVGEPLKLDGRELNVSCSIGLSTYPEHGEDADTLLRNADTAMYRVKAHARNGVQFYAKEMSARIGDRLAMIAALRRGLEREEFSLHYQPQVDLRTGRIFGAEALLRWRQPRMGMVPPTTFIPVAEECGLIVPIGAWVLQSACAQNQRWQEQGLPPITVAVNLSARQFRQKGMVRSIAQTLESSGLDPRYLELELTESMMMHSVEEVIHILEELKTLGVQVTVDDFGIGYSSLNYLKRFPVDRLKIDRSFVQDIGTDPDDTAIAHAIIALGHSLRLRVIAEGVESTDQLSFLRNSGCDEAQGYHFSPPVPAEQFENLLAEGGQRA